MTEPPNPFSREGAADAPRAQPNAGEPTDGPTNEPWPTYPGAPNSFGYDRTEIPAYGGGSGQPAGVPATSDPANPYPTGPYPTGPYPTGDPYAEPAQGPGAFGTSPYGPSAYAVSPYGYTPTTHPQAVPSLVLGIIGLVICPWVGIAAFVVGRRARKEIVAEPHRYAGLGLATTGWILGIVGIVWAVLVTLFFVLGFAGVYDR